MNDYNLRNYYEDDNLVFDSVHGYIPFSDSKNADEVSERDIINSGWVQRLRQIHQLQTAWFVYPTAEHSRFQHSLGSMHLASKVIDQLYTSLLDTCVEINCNEKLPSRNYLESLVRMAALLHDVGHGPFGHFFDSQYLSKFNLNHEKLGAEIICTKFAPMLRKIRQNPHGKLDDNETLDPEQIAFLIVRPTNEQSVNVPFWLRLLRSLFSGLYTVDNMDFVLRDAYMTGFGASIIDIDRLIHYSFFTAEGLTIHQKGFAALIRFLNVRGELFRSIYFHRDVRAIDLTLSELFDKTHGYIFPDPTNPDIEQVRNPLDYLDDYLRFTEWSLLVDVSRFAMSANPIKRELAPLWQEFLTHRIPFNMAAEKTILFQSAKREKTSIFGDEKILKQKIIDQLPEQLKSIDFKIDCARHQLRGKIQNETAKQQNLNVQNCLFDPATKTIHHLEDEDLFRYIPQSYRICRIYTKNIDHAAPLAEAMSRVAGGEDYDTETNM
ncbi:MAG: HD domain-containing protein [Planctomycetaceae bacterium]|jgi:HD superfamily phosphohydrolase|nr:HD domain-containing protein [Planctomycetaceae bacterium]